jgi:hypothetical protein
MALIAATNIVPLADRAMLFSLRNYLNHTPCGHFANIYSVYHR